ncbi:MAG: NAD(P)(+) transhydrogenase (Re/Si-specific) subunit beta [Desulfobulbaceae bacterium]|nr:NAD(P)(+) transhydrogenase (Re/Si-specific) subunit beta [Desulfobulbaceae bacterium]
MVESISVETINFVYLLSAVLFMLGLMKLSSPATAKLGNKLSMAGMGLAIAATLLSPDISSFKMIVIGIAVGAVIGGVAAVRVEMTSMPEMVALFNGCGGAASALVALAEFQSSGSTFSSFNMVTLILSVIVGALTFTGSVIAFGKLKGYVPSRPICYPGQQVVNALILLAVAGLGVAVYQDPTNLLFFYAIIAISLLLGVLAVIPIGGADMPVIISLLNSYSGVAVAMTGFALANNALIVVGSLVGASGLFLTKIMCDAMNRSLANVLFGAFGSGDSVAGDGVDVAGPGGSVKGYEVDDVATVLENATSLIVVPGYGMAAAQAQHVVRELCDYLESQDVEVRYAIHPVAGRMPGHMNVLLAEADVSYDLLFAMEDINDDFSDTDAVLVIGANDVVNPAAKTNPSSPIFGMPILNVDEARTVVVLKRSMNPGFAGIENELFLKDNTMMLFGDAKKSVQDLLLALKE